MLDDDQLFELWRERFESARAGVGPLASSAATRSALGRFMETLGRELASTALRRARYGPRMPSWTLGQEAVVCTLGALGRELVSLPPREVRTFVDSLQGLVAPRTDVRVETAPLGHVGSLRFVPSAVDERAPVIVHFHGGGYVFGSPRTYAGHLAELAHVMGGTVVAPYYSLAPEAPHPAALEDACSALSAILAREDAARVILAGDSAGGGLALSCLLRHRDAGGPMPAGVVLSSPWVDLDADDGAGPHDGRFDWADRAFLDHFAALFVGGAERADPSASPARAPLDGLPPIRIQLGGVELFRPQNEVLVRRARAAGTDARVHVWPEMVHAFWALGPLFPAEQALHQVAAWAWELGGK